MGELKSGDDHIHRLHSNDEASLTFPANGLCTLARLKDLDVATTVETRMPPEGEP